jgi:heptaprenyl diphosphate synthase
MKTRRIALLALLTTIALTIYVAESQIPPFIPLPGIKLGFANIVTLLAITVLSRREALVILIMRIFFGSVFAGNFSSIIFSLTGGLLAWAVMATLRDFFKGKHIWILSVFGAIAHNAGQLIAAVLVTGTGAILYYSPFLLASAIAAGSVCGFIATYLIGHFPIKDMERPQ